MFCKLICIALVLCPILCIDVNFPFNSDDELKQQKEIFDRDYNDLHNKRLQHFFDSFKMELSIHEAKKLLVKLMSLDNDFDHFVESKEMISKKEIDDFINTGLRLIHKNFSFENNIDEFSEKNADELDFVFQSNAMNEDFIKTSDWNSKKLRNTL